jgi:hypothetical protein
MKPPLHFLMILLVSAGNIALAGDITTNTVYSIDKDKDGKPDFLFQEIYRGTNKILSVTRTRHSIDRIFHVPGSGSSLSERDRDGDGSFELVTILQDGEPIGAFHRHKDGSVAPMPSTEFEEKLKQTEDLREGVEEMISIIKGTNQQQKAAVKEMFPLMLQVKKLEEQAQKNSQPQH